jgi:hypothetical protein
MCMALQRRTSGCIAKPSNLPTPKGSYAFSLAVLYVLLLPQRSNFCLHRAVTFIYWVIVKMERVKGIEPSFRSTSFRREKHKGFRIKMPIALALVILTFILT